MSYLLLHTMWWSHLAWNYYGATRCHEVPRGRGHGTLLLARLLYPKWCSYLAENHWPCSPCGTCTCTWTGPNGGRTWPGPRGATRCHVAGATGPCCWPGSCTPSGAPTWPRTTACLSCPALHVLLVHNTTSINIIRHYHGTLLLARLLYPKWCSYLAENHWPCSPCGTCTCTWTGPNGGRTWPGPRGATRCHVAGATGPCCWPGSCTTSGAPTWPRTAACLSCPALHYHDRHSSAVKTTMSF